MTGIILTLIAVLLVLCFAFYHTDHPSGNKRKTDAFFYLNPKRSKKSYSRQD